MPDRSRRVVGLIANTFSEVRPAGLPVDVHATPPDDMLPPVASGHSHIDGGFVIPLDERAEGTLQRHGQMWLTVGNRFGRRIQTAGPFMLEEAQDGLYLEIELAAVDDLPEAKPFRDPYETLYRQYPREIEVLRNFGIGWEDLGEYDTDKLAGEINLDSRRLAAFRLHGEMNVDSPAFDSRAAETLAAVDVRGRAQLANLEPAALLGLVRRAEEQGRISLEGFEPSHVGDWIILARGWDFPGLYRPFEPSWVAEVDRKLWGTLVRLNPDYSELVHLIEAGYWAQVSTIAQMRSILTSAGVYDLSALDPFVIRRRTVIGPGYHFRPAKRGVAMLDDFKLYDLMIAQGGGFAKVKTVDATDFGVSIVPNPVKDAVILGPLMQFIENGELVISNDVANLIIVTESIDYETLNNIRYENSDARPPTPAPFPGRPGLPSNPANITSAYRPGSADRKGRDGLRGIDGASGRDGFTNADPPPSLKLYVKSTPKGLPDIALNGRPGGFGQDGQDGGPGEDGAKGRESVGSVWLFCVTNVGHGGDAGNGGNGGMGGTGGMGSPGGNLELYTPLENLDESLSRPFAINLAGGEGGKGGSGGAAGPGGFGGEAGHDTAGCDAHPEWHGANGMQGLRGADGGFGGKGPVGKFGHVPITLDQWNTAFTYPYLLRLEPLSGAPGTKINAVGLNISEYSALEFGGADIDATFDSTKNTVTFTVPDDASGGLTKVMIKTKLTGGTVPGLDKAMSNSLYFRVTPQIDSISPTAGAPGQSIKVTGKGFTVGDAQVILGGKALPPDTDSFSTTEFTTTLPFLEDIGLPAGPLELTVQNPDGALSNPVTFTLSLIYSLRMRAWRVFPQEIVAGGGMGSFGTNRTVSEIKDILVNNENSPGQLWARQGIAITLGPVVDAHFPEPWGDGSVPKNADVVPIAGTSTADGGGIPFDPGAINFYFINDIDDATTHAYTDHKLSLSENSPTPPTVVFEDTASLSTAKAAIVASHEVGHALGLKHVCAKDEDSETVSETLFGRVCEDLDQEYLMYPRANWYSHTGSTLTSQEAILARRAAAKLHGK